MRLAGALHEELYRGRRCSHRGIVAVKRKPTHLVHPLFLQIEHFAGSDDRTHPGRGLQDAQQGTCGIVRRDRFGCKQRLEVVEDQQALLALQHLREPRNAITARREVAAQRRGNGSDELVGRMNRFERDPARPVRESRSDLRRERVREPRFSGASQAMQRDESAMRFRQEPVELRQFVDAAHETGCRNADVLQCIGRERRGRRRFRTDDCRSAARGESAGMERARRR
jgi:hypothetical protein